MSKWTNNDMQDQLGEISIVTGGNAGLSYETTVALALKGAPVIMASRTLDKAEAASNKLLQKIPTASIESMKSVKRTVHLERYCLRSNPRCAQCRVA